MNHLNNMKQVILVQFDQSIRQLLHINGSSSSLSLLLSICLLPRSILVTWNRASLAEDIDECGAWVLEGDNVYGLVMRLGKVEIMDECILPSLLGGEEVDCHVEFTPSFILAAERRRREGLKRTRLAYRGDEGGEARHTLDRILKGGMEVVGYSVEARGWLLIASFVEEVDFNVPSLHWKSLNVRRLITMENVSTLVHLWQKNG
jgi:hypothetical protein